MLRRDRRVDKLWGRLREFLREAESLDPETVTESRKKVSLWDLEGSPVRTKNVICNSFGVDTIWDLVHVPYDQIAKFRCFSNSRAALSELVFAFDEAIGILKA